MDENMTEKRKRRKKHLKLTDGVGEYEDEEYEHLAKRLLYLEAFDLERHVYLGQYIHNRTGWKNYIR